MWGSPGLSSAVYRGYGDQASGDAGISAAPVRSSEEAQQTTPHMHRPLYKTESMPNPNQSQNEPTVTILSEWEYLCFYLSKLSKQIRCDKKIRFYLEHQNSCGVKWKHWMHKRHWTGSQCSNEACMCWRWISLFPCYRRQCVCMCCEKATMWPYTYMGPVLWSVPLELGGYLWGSACPSAYSLPSSCWL